MADNDVKYGLFGKLKLSAIQHRFEANCCEMRTTSPQPYHMPGSYTFDSSSCGLCCKYMRSSHLPPFAFGYENLSMSKIVPPLTYYVNMFFSEKLENFYFAFVLIDFVIDPVLQ